MRKWRRRISVIARLSLVNLLLCFALTGCIQSKKHPIADDALLPDGKPIGQPLSTQNPQIRMLRVDSYNEALGFFKTYCKDSNFMTERVGFRNCLIHQAENGDIFVFADSTDMARREVATMYFRSDSINRLGVERIIFVETIKPNNKRADSEKPEIE